MPHCFLIWGYLKLGKEYEMSEEKTNIFIENKVKSLEERINALEIKLEIEREDLDKLN